MTVSITFRDGVYAVSTPYSPAFVARLKDAIPNQDRKFEGSSKCWLVHPKHGQVVQTIIKAIYNQDVVLPVANAAPTVVKYRAVEVRYVGMIKDREDFTRSAYGFANGDWSIVFPEDVLKEWFKEKTTKQDTGPRTLYTVLTLDNIATQDEIKTAYRRLAKQWHPDVCKEPNAHDKFIELQRAYESLSDPSKRKKYDAGLKLMESTDGHRAESLMHRRYYDFQSPLRCGEVHVSGAMVIGRLHVSKIHEWFDITNDQGQILVSSWRRGADKFEEAWVNP